MTFHLAGPSAARVSPQLPLGGRSSPGTVLWGLGGLQRVMNHLDSDSCSVSQCSKCQILRSRSRWGGFEKIIMCLNLLKKRQDSVEANKNVPLKTSSAKLACTWHQISYDKLNFKFLASVCKICITLSQNSDCTFIHSGSVSNSSRHQHTFLHASFYEVVLSPSLVSSSRLF